MFGKEFEVLIFDNSKPTTIKYLDLDEATQQVFYHKFKRYYDTYIQRTLK